MFLKVWSDTRTSVARLRSSCKSHAVLLIYPRTLTSRYWAVVTPFKGQSTSRFPQATSSKRSLMKALLVVLCCLNLLLLWLLSLEVACGNRLVDYPSTRGDQLKNTPKLTVILICHLIGEDISKIIAVKYFF